MDRLDAVNERIVAVSWIYLELFGLALVHRNIRTLVRDNSGLSVAYRWRIGGLSVAYRWLIGGLSVAYRWLIGGLSVAYRWLIGGLSGDLFCSCQLIDCLVLLKYSSNVF